MVNHKNRIIACDSFLVQNSNEAVVINKQSWNGRVAKDSKKLGIENWLRKKTVGDGPRQWV